MEPNMDTHDPQGKRFLLLALLFVLIGVGSVRGGFDALSSPDLIPHGVTGRMMLCVIKLVTLGIGAVSIIIAKKFVDKYADRRHR
jgi:hypothetical protein